MTTPMDPAVTTAMNNNFLPYHDIQTEYPTRLRVVPLSALRLVTRTRQLSSHSVGICLMLGAALLWSTNGLGIRSLDIPSFSFSGWRSLFALPVLSLLLLNRVRHAGPVAQAPLRTPWAWSGAACYVVTSVSTVIATKMTTVASAMFIRYTAPVYVALLSWPLLRERVTWRQGVACAGVVVGLLFVFRDAITPSARAGNAVAILASFAAAGLALNLRADQKALARIGASRAASVSPAFAVLVGNLLGLVVCLPSMVASPPHGALQWGVIAALGVGQIGLAYVLFTLAVPRLTALETSLVPVLEPVLTPIWVLLAMGERIGLNAIIGAGVILGSVLLPSMRKKKAVLLAVP